jgi:hypothetical protein
MSGLVVGGFGGVIRSSTPTLFALASGIQWFTLGTTFWGSYNPQLTILPLNIYSSIKRIHPPRLGQRKSNTPRKNFSQCHSRRHRRNSRWPFTLVLPHQFLPKTSSPLFQAVEEMYFPEYE